MKMNISDLGDVGVSLVVTAIVLGIGASILGSIANNADTSINTSDTATWNLAYNATVGGANGINTLASYQPVIALVSAAAVVVGIVMYFFSKRGGDSNV